MFWRKKKEPERSPAPAAPQPVIADHEWQRNVVAITDDGRIGYNVNFVAEAMLPIKQLKQHKKQIALEKREVAQGVTAINAERRVQVASQGRMVRGVGSFGKLARTMQASTRDGEKRTHAARLQL